RAIAGRQLEVERPLFENRINKEIFRKALHIIPPDGVTIQGNGNLLRRFSELRLFLRTGHNREQKEHRYDHPQHQRMYSLRSLFFTRSLSFSRTRGASMVMEVPGVIKSGT